MIVYVTNNKEPETLHPFSYIRHFVQKLNHLLSLGKHCSKRKTHLAIVGTYIQPGNTCTVNRTPIGLSLSTTNKPQVSHFENFASMKAMRVGVRGGQRERGVERGRGRGQRRGPVRRRVSDDIRATLVDHVINHGLSMREAGQRVHPNLSRYTVASIIRTFRLENRYIFKFLLQTVPTACVT